MASVVSKRFTIFLENIALTSTQIASGNDRRERVVRALNDHYWGSQSTTKHSRFIGSWGKYTRVRPPRDVDVLFELPDSVYHRFEGRTGNRQSQLLQEVKGVLATTFTTTSLKGDGPVVKVPFTSYNVELIPAFSLTNGQYWVCMTDSGGYYKNADYEAESRRVKASNDSTKNNTRRLIRMMKRWQAYCSVPIRSFWIELVVMDFLDGWAHSKESSVYYDWMVRDFLKHLEGKANSTVYAPGTYEAMDLGDAWLSRTRMARRRAEKACDNEADYPVIAGEEWQKIFGTDIPKCP